MPCETVALIKTGRSPAYEETFAFGGGNGDPISNLLTTTYWIRKFGDNLKSGRIYYYATNFDRETVVRYIEHYRAQARFKFL